MFLDLNSQKYSLILCMRPPVPILMILWPFLVGNTISQAYGLLSHFPSKHTLGSKKIRKNELCVANEGEVFTDRLEHYTHLGNEWLGCSCLGEDTYLNLSVGGEDA